MDLALNNLQRLICHKIQQTKPNSTKNKNLYSLYDVLKCLIYAVFRTKTCLYENVANF